MPNHHHTFMFTPGIWIGEGTVSFSLSSEEIRFFTKWSISPSQDGITKCEQTVEIQGSDEHVINNYTLKEVSSSTFELLLENQMLDKISGTGLIDPEKIAWEFRGHETFEGFEVYTLKESGEYHFHAEYASPDQFRTIINGRLWKKDQSNQ